MLRVLKWHPLGGAMFAVALLVNCYAEFGLTTIGFAANCNTSSITNTSDCATSQDVKCRTYCNSSCTNEEQRIYLGSTHGVLVTGTWQTGSNSVLCWTSQTCEQQVVEQRRCFEYSGPGALPPNYCESEVSAAHNCTFCAAVGSGTPHNITNYYMAPCVEE